MFFISASLGCQERLLLPGQGPSITEGSAGKKGTHRCWAPPKLQRGWRPLRDGVKPSTSPLGLKVGGMEQAGPSERRGKPDARDAHTPLTPPSMAKGSWNRLSQ